MNERKQEAGQRKRVVTLVDVRLREISFHSIPLSSENGLNFTKIELAGRVKTREEQLEKPKDVSSK